MILQRLSLSGRGKSGFTLVELAIVLSVASLLFAGLWRLMAGGNTQLRDQAAADMHRKFISATKTYLSSADGQTYLTGFTDLQTKELLSSAGAVDAGATGFTDALGSAGLAVSTTNSYGQRFSIRVLADRNPAASTGVPESYSFMILTSGGSTITDTSGGRIVSAIGAEGGFVYESVVCGGVAADMACGAYGGWSSLITSYGFTALGASGKGHIASRSYSGSDSAFGDSWLARKQMAPVDDYNTMQTNMFFQGSNLYTAAERAALPVGPHLYMQGSNINLRQGFIDGGWNSGLSGTSMQGMGRVTISLGGQTVTQGNGGDSALTVTSSAGNGGTSGVICTRSGPNNPNNCPLAITVNGDVSIPQGALQANVLYAGSFVYSNSDARLKHDIKPIENALDKLSKIRGLEFKMNQGNEERLGVIAQEVEKVFPQVIYGKGDDYKGVDYTGLIGPLIAAVNELRLENDKVMEQLKRQAAEIEKLKNKTHTK